MKKEIQPQFEETTITCACGATFKTHSSKDNIQVEVCRNLKRDTTGGRADKFKKKYGIE